MKKDIKPVLLLFVIAGVSIVADYYNMYTPLVITTILYAIFEICKIMDYNAWVFQGLEDKEIMRLQIWTMYIIGAVWYILGEYYNVPKIGVGL